MVRENSERNTVIYSLWERGSTIDEICLETGIPRSTVGYYVRKFNKRARRGEEIVIPLLGQQSDPKALAINAFAKGFTFNNILELMKTGDLDRVYKILMIYKLLKELQRDMIPSEEERKALFDNLGYVITEFAKASKLAQGK